MDIVIAGIMLVGLVAGMWAISRWTWGGLREMVPTRWSMPWSETETMAFSERFYRTHMLRHYSQQMKDFAEKMATQKIDLGSDDPQEAA